MGVAICDVETQESGDQEDHGVLPEKFYKLENFFQDLKKDVDLFENVNWLDILKLNERIESPKIW